MITRSEVTILCRRLEGELQNAGFIFDDLQFDEDKEILCIVVDDGPKRRLSRSPWIDSGEGATIDARILWDLLRDFMRLGRNPAIQLRYKRSGSNDEVRGHGNLRLGLTPMSLTFRSYLAARFSK
jgi:hypothetical protein